MKRLSFGYIILLVGFLFCLILLPIDAIATSLSYYLRVDNTLTYIASLHPDDPYLPGYPSPGIYGTMTVDISGQGTEVITIDDITDFTFFWISDDVNDPSDWAGGVMLQSQDGKIESGSGHLIQDGSGGVEFSGTGGVFDFLIEDWTMDHAYFTSGKLYFDPVPEPSTMLLLASGLIGLAGFRRKFRK